MNQSITLSTLAYIFYSGTFSDFGDRTLLQKVLFLLEHNYLSYNAIKIADKSTYIATASDPDLLSQTPEADGGSACHIALKLLAQRYLAKLNVASTLEQPFCGYYPDVMSLDKTIIVECGHTSNIEKIFVYFTQGNIQSFIQIPYPNEAERFVRAYIFTPEKELSEFLRFEQSESMSAVKDILKNR